YVALLEQDQPLLAESEIRHCEEPILLLAAETREIAREAASRIAIDYEELPPVLSIEEALRAEHVIYGEANVLKHFLIARGDVDAALDAADLIVEGGYRVPHQEQLYIEPQGMIAIAGEGEMTVLGSMQCPYYVHKAIKTLFGLPD